MTRFRFEGAEVTAAVGQSVAAALWAAGIRTLGRNPSDGTARGMLCAMGSCQECVVVVDGERTEACRVVARDGLVVTAG
jgi:predicted molibdopterin-dependent oxidoreductase YjgC